MIKKTVKTKKKTSSTKKEEMRGIVNTYFTAIKEQVTPINAAQEYIDNAFDSGATEIDMNFDTRNSSFMISDNGVGFTDEEMRNYATNFSSHTKKGNTIGIRGVGSKNAFIALADFGNANNPVAKASIVSSPDGVNFNRIVWTLSTNEYMSTHPDVDYNFHDDNKHKGTTIAVQPIVQIWGGIARLSRYIAEVYPYRIQRDNVNVKINGKSISARDHMYLSILGKDIENVGIHIKEGLVFIVKEYNLVNQANRNDRRTVKAVHLAVTKDKNERLLGSWKDDRSTMFAGIYTMKCGRYLDLHNHSKEMGCPNLNHGGTGFVRSLIILDGNEDIFGVKGNKSAGIQPLAINNTLAAYVMENTDTTFFEAFEADVRKSYKISLYEREGHSAINGNGHNKVTVDVVKQIFDGEGKPRKRPKDAADVIATPYTITVQEAKELLQNQQNEDAVIELHTNQETGATEYCFTEAMPKQANKELISLLTQIMIDNKVGRRKIENICSSLAYSLSK